MGTASLGPQFCLNIDALKRVLVDEDKKVEEKVCYLFPGVFFLEENSCIST
jgi:hypothetical protein